MAYAAEFQVAPYLYSGEANLSVNATSFQYNGALAKIYKINGEEAMISLDGALVTDKPQMSAMLTNYYSSQFYPSQAELSEIASQAKAFNDSRNALVTIGVMQYPAEKTCMGQGTYLAYKPCNDLLSCTQTASLVCTISGADGCTVDLLAIHILAYSKGINQLNAAYAKFSSAYGSFSASNIASSLDSMDAAFDDMKAAANNVSASKLRQPNRIPCNSGCTPAHPENCCLGVCPEARFDTAAITSGKEKIAALRAKTQPIASLDMVIEKVAISTQDRLKYREGEEKAKIFQPRFTSATAKFAGLKAQAVEAKALVADSQFVSAAGDFINKGDVLEQKVLSRQFDGFDAALSGYESSGAKLQSMINNSTVSYYKAVDAQDDAGDAILQAQWRVSRLSKQSVDSYNLLAEKKNKLDAEFAPPKTSTEYSALSAKYQNVTLGAKTFVAASKGAQESVFGAGNAFSRASVDAAMGLVSSMVPVSFKTRQSFAQFVPPLLVGAIDLIILFAAIAIFAYVFLHFRRFFHSKIAVSGWVLTLLGFMFILIIGSVGFYSIVISTERFTSFTEFMDTVQGAKSVALIVDEKGASTEGIAGMRACAEQIEAKMRLQGKTTMKYYIGSTACTSILQKGAGNGTGNVIGNGTAKLQFDTKTGLLPSACLDSIPDVPIFDLQFSSENKIPTFTTVVTKQALISGNGDYYSKKPMCDIANVLD
ncbi:MAG: hypothetical protein NT051_06440 [Candidatus Micrarchaeota archaeon]|nr:hypothetical protein [Candidatus Micrarchaeota archaeon]